MVKSNADLVSGPVKTRVLSVFFTLGGDQGLKNAPHSGYNLLIDWWWLLLFNVLVILKLFLTFLWVKHVLGWLYFFPMVIIVIFSVAAAKTKRGLCLAQYCIFITITCILLDHQTFINITAVACQMFLFWLFLFVFLYFFLKIWD